jgi:hypothetical protein
MFRQGNPIRDRKRFGLSTFDLLLNALADCEGGPQLKIGRGEPEKEHPMFQNLDDMQKVTKVSLDMTMKSFELAAKNAQTIATEMTDYTKRSFEKSTKTLNELLGAKSLDKVMEVQSDFAKSAYEDYFTQAAKIGKLCTDFSQEAFRPYETFTAKQPTKQRAAD